MSYESDTSLSQDAESLQTRAALTAAFEFVVGGGLGYLALKSGLPYSAIEGASATGFIILGGVETGVAIRARRVASDASGIESMLAAQQGKHSE